jgi:hypothetical protein
MKKSIELVQPTLQLAWKKTTCKQARRLQAQGCMIWWRPNGTVTRETPDQDLALYVEN